MSDIPIKVEVIRSGGFAGTETRVAVDTEQLPADRATEIRSLVEQLGPAGLTGQSPNATSDATPNATPGAAAERAVRSPTGYDRFQYDLEIQIGDDVQRFSVDETAAPSELKSLIDTVTRYGGDG